ncbi:hypothetical protein NDR87_15185 [Nocardia sp. CDC159]|uniref:Uncharacterized protein n=1 Tax=Nocardia pulmonis TaxID=2951408 RepID=A0A9X2E8J1_9NOCA|nr:MULTISPECIES: hypothetical protein [Nocardia]MCM6775565.1 hypothetical protein [Nocardia pulmonis]MCM6787701.1 hypothetical protein [Nocardia sp. CDC159]
MANREQIGDQPMFDADLHTATPPLSGSLVAESERSVSVRVTDGVWTFDRADVLSIVETDGAPTTSERPVRVRIRSGATAEFTRRLRIDLTERPMTLGHPPSPARGDELLARLTTDWARELRLPATPGVGGATFTYIQTKTDARSDDGTACDSLD